MARFAIIVSETSKGDDMADDTTQADGYYGEDNMGDQEVDLSFLDDDAKTK